MPPSNSPLAYGDIRTCADRALANGRGVTLRVHSHGEAVSERARFYKMRELDRRASTKVFPSDDPRHGVSAYDRLVVSVAADGDQIVLLFEVATAERLEERIEEL